MEGLIGEIRPFAGDFAPVDWLSCTGTTLSIMDYQQLYALIGTTYGGDGKTTFRIPDLRSKMAVGQGQGPGLTIRPVGLPGGYCGCDPGKSKTYRPTAIWSRRVLPPQAM